MLYSKKTAEASLLIILANILYREVRKIVFVAFLFPIFVRNYSLSVLL